MNAMPAMPAHSDAVGYLNDLAKEINEPWFKMICDLTTVSSMSALDQPTQDTLFAIYIKRASYLAIGSAEAAAGVAIPAASTDFLEQLSRFANFKFLGDTLDVCFKKRITLIFGANGSGKSSLCDSLKVLATHEQPNRPLQNVRSAGVAMPEFRYKFRSDRAMQVWTPAVGYGPRQATVKYFDTAIAIRNVKNAVDPGRVIVLSPFKLHVFEWAKALTTKFREALQRSQLENSQRLTQALESIRTEFSMFNGQSLAHIDSKTVAFLPSQIKLGEKFTGQELLRERRTALSELNKAASEEGLKFLRAEYRELEAFLTSLSTLLTSTSGLWALEPATKAEVLAKKQAEQEMLARVLIPKDQSLDDLFALLRSASTLCNMDDATDHVCPLCKRELSGLEVDLFKRYYDLLSGELEKDIAMLKGDIAKAVVFATAVVAVDRKAWKKISTIQADILIAANTASDLIAASCNVSEEPTAEAKAALESLEVSIATWTIQLESKGNAIEAAVKGRDELVKQLTKARSEIEPLEYAQAIADCLEKLRQAQRMAAGANFWDTQLPAFTQLLRKLTEKAKDAHEELVVADFESRLNAEYKTLTEKNMAAFGVILARKGADAVVTVLPQVGGADIESVLSEGEQRVHALALFFAELETCTQSVVVFDDPISSFDYNYIANYCARLRDFTQKHPTRQVIALTHNWEFFVQLQTTLNQAGLDPHLSVQVLENCAVVADYSEKIDDLKRDIDAVLVIAGEPSKYQKENIAGKMRRLIEAVVNTHVFNQQRHQYKQKTQAISAFQDFTKIVPLLPAEATTLRDLYAKLSITEHDDPRNSYVIADKAMFQSRYDAIKAVESAVIGRK